MSASRQPPANGTCGQGRQAAGSSGARHRRGAIECSAHFAPTMSRCCTCESTDGCTRCKQKRRQPKIAVSIGTCHTVKSNHGSRAAFLSAHPAGWSGSAGPHTRGACRGHGEKVEGAAAEQSETSSCWPCTADSAAARVVALLRVAERGRVAHAEALSERAIETHQEGRHNVANEIVPFSDPTDGIHANSPRNIPTS